MGICCETNTSLRHAALQDVTTFSYEKAVDTLADHIDDEACLTACQSILWYVRDKYGEWVDMLVIRLPGVNMEKTFQLISYIREKGKLDQRILGCNSSPRFPVAVFPE